MTAEATDWTPTHCRAALSGASRRIEAVGRTEPPRLWAKHFVPLPGEGTAVEARLPQTDLTEGLRL